MNVIMKRAMTGCGIAAVLVGGLYVLFWNAARLEYNSGSRVQAPASPKSAVAQVALLEQDLALLDEKIRRAQADVDEYRRLHDIHRVAIIEGSPRRYLKSLVGQRVKTEQELLLLEAKHPFLSDTNAPASVSAAQELRNRHTGLTIRLGALKAVEDKWRTKFLLDDKRKSELKHLQDRVKGFEQAYTEIYSRVHELIMKDRKERRKSLQDDSVDSDKE